MWVSRNYPYLKNLSGGKSKVPGLSRKFGNMGAGRPTDYEVSFPDKVYKLCLLGATDAEIADFFEIAESTLNLWKEVHPEFMESIKRGKLTADAEVASSLFKIANGYQYDEVTYEKIGDGDSKTEVTETGIETVKQDRYKKKVVTKEVPPNVVAQSKWLNNRRGRVKEGAQKWADKQEHGITDNEGNDVPLVQVFQLPDNNRNTPANEG